MPRGHLRPVIDGEVTHFYEWYEGGTAEIRAGGGAMHKGPDTFEKLRFGFDEGHLFLLLDSENGSVASALGSNAEVRIEFRHPVRRRIRIRVGEEGRNAETTIEVQTGPARTWTPVDPDGLEAAVATCLEVACPLELLGTSAGDTLALVTSIGRPDGTIERYPSEDSVRIQVPARDPDVEFWSV
jgi:hypothetical protein